MKQTHISLFHGFQNNGSWIRHANIRQINGYDEQMLAENVDLPSVLRITELLQHTIISFKDVIITEENYKREIVRHLTIGDRVALILHLRKLTFGDVIQCVMACPSCKRNISLDLSITNLLLKPPQPQPSAEYIVTLKNSILKIRPITGSDLESLLAEDDDNNQLDSRAHVALVKYCIVSAETHLPENLTDDLVKAISEKLTELDPQADIILNLTCPNCQQFFKTSFDAEDFFFKEIQAYQTQLELEVHTLAFNYHWSEDSILSLSLQKRKRYHELITKALSG